MLWTGTGREGKDFIPLSKLNLFLVLTNSMNLITDNRLLLDCLASSIDKVVIVIFMWRVGIFALIKSQDTGKEQLLHGSRSEIN